jgi:transcriptional regulator with XRE-family HTH domain
MYSAAIGRRGNGKDKLPMTAPELHDETPEPTTIGERLVRAREAAGLSLSDIANQTRIPVRHLQHIEQEEWDALPAPTYAVGFVRSYANAVGLDGPAISRDLRQQLGGVRSRAPAPEYYQPADPARVPPRAIAIAAAVIAVLLIIGYTVWRSSLVDTSPSAAEITLPPPAQVPSPSSRPTPALQPASLAGQPVTLTSTGEVWLRITEGPGGSALFQGTLSPGQTFQVPASATHPLLRTGRPQLLRASAGGRDLGALDTTEHTVSDLSLLAPDIAARAASTPASANPSTASPPAPAAAPPATQ